MIAPAIRAEGLVKRFGSVVAVDGVDLEVAPGTVLGVLGPNGAGKTTAVRILTTILRPDGGRAEVLGFDVARQPEEVRMRIGLAGQYAAVDENLTGFENLEMVGRLYHLGRRVSPERRRAPRRLRPLRGRRPPRSGDRHHSSVRRPLRLALPPRGHPLSC
ncbi:MAG TPA: ATP-binding cassette domain-containing protein [Acidimicrobiales bacterium]|nr:ATP-binding cassette domain-containing protein [Acidimicrobiales bacterium]